MMRGAGSMLSVAATEYETAAPVGPVASDEIGPGRLVKVGGWMSTSVTTTWKVAVPVFPLASVALHVTAVEPTANVVPGAGLQVASMEPATASAAVGTS